MVDGDNWEVVESGRLPRTWSAQACEIYALICAIRAIGEGVGTVYTDSKYAWGVVHVFGKIWKERGMVTSQGKEVTHRKLLETLLETVQGPEELAVVHVRGHQGRRTWIGKGHEEADKRAKEAAVNGKNSVVQVMTLISNIGEVPCQVFTWKDQEKLRKMGPSATRMGSGKCLTVG